MTSRDPNRPPVPRAGAAGAGDAELLAAVRAGDRAALGELYRRHRPRVAAYLGRRMVCAGDVEDVVQDTFRYLDGYSTAAAAIVAGSSPGAVATNCLAARARLRVELADLAPPADPLARCGKVGALRVAFAAVGVHDVGAALGWLRERGIRMDPCCYAYAIHDHRRGTPVADPPAAASQPGRWAA